MSAPLSKKERGFVRKAGSILRDCLKAVSGEIKKGVSTKTLESIADEFIARRGGIAAFRGYKGFPAAICASRNEVVVHGIPAEKEILIDGDIIAIDVGVEYEGYFADGAKTFKVGKVSGEAERLVSVAEEALIKGIEMAVPKNHIQDISWAIQSFVESHGFSVVRAFVGHGIGGKIHDEPEVPNFGKPHKGSVIEEGMALAIEPMVNEGVSDVEVLGDGWTAVTKDRKLSAHFEHTVIVGGARAEIVT